MRLIINLSIVVMFLVIGQTNLLSSPENFFNLYESSESAYGDLSTALNVEYCWDNENAKSFDKTVKTIAYGTLVDKAPDTFIDPLWFGSAQGGPIRFDGASGSFNWTTGYYGDIITFRTPDKPCNDAGYPIISFNDSHTKLKWGEIVYGGIDWHISQGRFIYLEKNAQGKWVPKSNIEYAFDYMLWDHEYTILVYATNNDAKGTYQLDLSYTSCMSHHCKLELDHPLGPHKYHCYASDGILWMDASKWVTGCGNMTYKWVTPEGIVHGPVLDGKYGYGKFYCEIICHDAYCAYEKVGFQFDLKEYCHHSCTFHVKPPMGSSLDHCYDSKGILWMDASSWVSGCSKRTYKWITPKGTVHGSVLDGYYGYGHFSCEVVCHDASCYYEVEKFSFYLKDECHQHCYFEVDSPIASSVDHCYETDGIVWIDAKSWVTGCNNVTYKWSTPEGTVHGSVLDGKYGYGNFKLTVTCHDAKCHYETRTASFYLKKTCQSYQHYTIHCPEDVWLDCEDELWDLDLYGNPYYIRNGHKVWEKGDKVKHHLNDCNSGYITREWKVKDPHGKWTTCEQHIYVGESSTSYHDIDWPKKELMLEGCNPSTKPKDLPSGYREPSYDDDGCSKLGHTYKDEVFWFESTCKKIVRKWTVIDWCSYSSNSYSDNGKYTFTQTIKVSNTDEPTVELPDDLTYTSTDCKKAIVKMDDLKVSAESCGDKFKITHNSAYAYKEGDNASGVYPYGTTEVIFKVKYGCGYTKSYKIDVHVVSNADPTAYCIYKLVMPLRGIDTDGDGTYDDGEVEIWAKDFDLGSTDNCGDELSYSFEEDELVMSKRFTCEDVGVNNLNIYISNSHGVVTYCSVQLDIQNNAANIPDCEPDGGDTDDDEGDATDGDDNEGHDSEDGEEENVEEETTEDENVGDDEDSADEGDSDSEMSDSDSDGDNDGNDSSEETEETEMASVSGLILTSYDAPVEEVTLNLYSTSEEVSTEPTFEIVETIIDSFVGGSGAMLYIRRKDTVFTESPIQTTNIMDSNTFSNEEGSYLFVEVEMHNSYMLEPKMEVSGNIAIDNSDADRLYLHLTGDEPLTNPYALLAADIDQSGEIDFDDLKILWNNIDGISNSLEEEEMIFIDANYVFEDETNPWDEDYASTHSIASLDIETYESDFIAIKLGDIVATADAIPSLLSNSNRERKAFNAIVTPNPFNARTSIRFDNPETQTGTVTFYSANGEKVFEESRRFRKGVERIDVSTLQLKIPGVYFYTIQLGEIFLQGKMLKVD